MSFKMSAEKLYSEIFEEFVAAPDKDAKIALLRKNGDPRFIEFIVSAFHTKLHWDVQPMEYRPALEPAGLNHTYLDMEVPKLYRFVRGHPARTTNVSQDKLNKLFKIVLESLHKDEADLLIRCIRKDLNVPGLTIKLLREAFPNVDFGKSK
jgi:hypothetical protein|tara:strand:+ start:101 stop:553 length:453 start_codon:yes stop_codon:yes gene_type:complete